MRRDHNIRIPKAIRWDFEEPSAHHLNVLTLSSSCFSAKIEIERRLSK
jgi:hypothetical protein